MKGFAVWNADLVEELGELSFAPPGRRLGPMRISALRNGTFSGQVVVGSTDKIVGLSAEVGALTRAGGGRIPAGAATVRYGLVGRTRLRWGGYVYGGPTGIIEECVSHGIRTGAGDERLKVGPAKIFTDGSAGGRTAAMREPYLGETRDRGIFLYGDDELDALVTSYDEAGYQIAIHAIGDAAIDQALASYERILDRSPGADRRHRIEHCGYIVPEHIRIMSRHGIYPAPQPVFIYDFGDLYLEVLGETRARTCYPMRTWMENGLHPAASTDAPVCGTSVMTNLYSMLTRKTAKGVTLGEDQRLTIDQAVSAASYNGAYLSFSESVKGTLLPGQLADIAVASTDIFSAAPEEILESEFDLTLLEGDIVYDRLQEHQAS